jgi:hypothetical protein
MTYAIEIINDSSPLFSGTHSGPSSSIRLRDKGALFRTLGCDPEFGLYIENVTQGTHGVVLWADDDEILAGSSGGTGFPYTFPFVFGSSSDYLTWDNGDTYNIYCTGTKNGFIASNVVDTSAGWFADPQDLDSHGWRNEDTDIDDHGKIDVFGPGQPERR